jgi:hypothetical protein
MEDEKPPTRRLVLKQKDVDPVDTVARPGDGTAISVRLIHLQNRNAAERAPGTWLADAAQDPPGSDAGDGGSSIFRPKEITPIDLPSQAGDEEAISVSGMLESNRAAAHALEPELIAMPPRRKSRRNRDFMLLIACALLSVGSLAVVFREDRQIVALSLFGIVFLTVILAWVMYGVMDRY